MIQQMRELAQSTVARVLIGIIIALLLLFGYGSFDIFNRVDKSVAKVNGTEISRADYEREVDSRRRASEPPVDNAAIQKETLDTMIKRSLVQGVAKTLGLTVSDAEITRRIMNEPAFVENGRFSQKLFEQRLQNFGLHPAAYRESLADGAVIEQVMQGVSESEFLTPGEMRRVEALINQQRDFAWVDVDPTRFAADVRADDASLQKYFAANARQFQVPESVVVDYIRIGHEGVGASISVSDADVEAEYRRAVAESAKQGERRHVAHIMLENRPGRPAAAAILQLRAAAQQIAGGKSFAEVAKMVSEDVSTKDLGGDLGFVGKGELPEKALDDAVWKMAVGSVSAPIVSSAGVHLLTVLEAKATVYPPLDEVRDQLRTKVREQRIRARLSSIKGELGEQAYEQDLAALAKRYGVQVQRSTPIPRVGVAPGIGSNAAVRTAAFSNDVRDGTFNSGVLDVDGDLVVLRLVKHQDARPMSFAEARDRVSAAMLHAQSLALAKVRAQQLVDGVRLTGSLTPSIQAFAVTWQSRAQAQRNAPDVPPPVVKAAFELPRPGAAVKAVGRVVQLENGHMAAVVVTRVVDGLNAPDSPQEAGLRGLLANQSGERQFGAYLDRLEAKADITRGKASVTDDASAAPAGTKRPQ